MGSDLRLAAFGSGIRVCPGKALGISTVLALACTVSPELQLDAF
jgi:cytochrome P450